MKIDFEDAAFLLRAGAAAQEWWNIADDVRIIEVHHSNAVIVPMPRRFESVPGDVDGSSADRPTFGQDTITLEKFVTGERVIRMGYGGLTRTLAVRIG